MKPVFLLFFLGVILISFQGLIPSTPRLNKPMSAPPPTEDIVLIAGGDVMLGRSVYSQSQKSNDSSWAFKNISQEFRNADISFINLESPITPNCKTADSGTIFCAPPSQLTGLVSSGIDVANIANNHILDHGQVGIDSTISYLKENNISPLDPDPVIVERAGVKFGFLGFNALEQLDRGKIASLIADINKQADVLIVSFHWGTEYTSSPSQAQISLAHLSIDQGADIVIGHHPHWVQTKEYYLGKPIYYSLGNLIFDQMWSEQTRDGLVVKFFFSGKNFITTQEYPVKIFNYGQPEFAVKSND